MRKLPEYIEKALVDRMNAAMPAYKDSVTGEIDVDGMLSKVVSDMGETEPGIYVEFTELAPLMLAREVYQQTARVARAIAKSQARAMARDGKVHDLTGSNWGEFQRDNPNILAVWMERMTPEVLRTQYSYRGRNRQWHRKEYGDLTTPEMQTLEEKYEADARSKQQTADMIRSDRLMFEHLQHEHFGDLVPSLTIRDFWDQPAVRAAERMFTKTSA